MNKVTQKSDHEIIEVDNKLKKKIVIKGLGEIDTAAIDRAEEALGKLSVNFDDWLEDEVANLVEARDNVRAHGLVGVHFDELFRIAHDIKGQGETLGYPLATMIGASLCKLLDVAEDKTIIPLALIDSHVDAVRRVMRDRIKTADHEVGRAVAERLVDVVLEFVDHEEAKQKANAPDAEAAQATA